MIAMPKKCSGGKIHFSSHEQMLERLKVLTASRQAGNDSISMCNEIWNILDRLYNNKTNDLILNLTPENVTQHSRIVTTTCKGSSTPTKMSKIIGRQIH